MVVMHAIPTTYGGVNFRSRLEARWAAFFDLLGWSWEYEPIDLAGYIPDFIVRQTVLAVPSGGSVRIESPILVEVKPLHEPQLCPSGQHPVGFEYLNTCRPVIEKILNSGWKGLYQIHGAWPGFLLGHTDDGEACSNAFLCLANEQQRASWREAGNRVQWRRPA